MKRRPIDGATARLRCGWYHARAVREPKLSIIAPFYNEEGNIRRMHAAIVAAVEPIGAPFEKNYQIAEIVHN